MRKSPTVLAALFLAITLQRIASLVSGPIGAPLVFAIAYAAGMGGMIYCAMYWSRTQTTRRAALVVAGVFVFADGAFNLFETLRVADQSTWYLVAGAWVYGILPTLAAGLAGWLQGKIDRLPPVQSKRRIIQDLADALSKMVLERIELARTGAKVAHKPAEPVRFMSKREFLEACDRRNGAGPFTVAELVEMGTPETTARNWVKSQPEKRGKK